MKSQPTLLSFFGTKTKDIDTEENDKVSSRVKRTRDYSPERFTDVVKK